jgi:DNA-binding LacI/PurR family transcriptional regulator
MHHVQRAAEVELVVPERLRGPRTRLLERSDRFQPRLTVIAQPMQAIGAQAVGLLLSRLDDPGRPPQSVRLQTTFVHRESCGC